MRCIVKNPPELLVLASKSQRRVSIIQNAWPFSFLVKPSNDKEGLPRVDESASAYTSRIALSKAISVFDTRWYTRFVVGADTAVSLNNSILLKPSTQSAAIVMLKSLRGKDHLVSTSVSIQSTAIEKPIVVNKITTVSVRDYSDTEIINYVNSKEPFDKSGGYAIQDKQFRPVKQINGCYLNVVGMPLCELTKLIYKVSPDFAKRIKLLSCTDCLVKEGYSLDNIREVK